MVRGQPACLLAAMALAGCTHANDGPSSDEAQPPPQPESGAVTLGGEEPISAAWVAGATVHGLPESEDRLELAGPINTLLLGTLAPAALFDGARNRLLYNSWRERRPVLRAHDLGSGNDRVLAEGAYGVALRRDGALAYVAGPDADLDDPRTYLGHVVVEAAGTPRTPWTRQRGRYVVAAWAGERLLAYRLREGWPDLLVLEEAGRERVLAEAGALVGLDPEGRRAFVSTYGAAPPLVRVLDVASGEELARLQLSSGELEWVSESGSWAGDLVAAASSAGVAIFRVREREIVLEQVLAFDAPELPVALQEPRLAPDGGSVAAAGELTPRPRQPVAGAVAVECDRLTRRCVRGPEVPHTDGPRFVYDPSRP